MFSFTVPGASGTPLKCYFSYFQGKYSAGQRLLGSLIADNRINFYVMSDDQERAFAVAPCGIAYAALVTAEDVASYSLDWIVPADGKYWFVFFNFARSVLSTGYVPDVIGSFSLRFSIVSATSTVVIFATTVTESSEYSEQVSAFWSPENTINRVFVVIAVIAAIVAFAVLRRKKTAAHPPPQVNSTKLEN